jgi:hypothetical protein
MLRAFFFLFSLLADYQTLIDIANIALILGLVNVGVFSCFGIRFGIRHSMANRDVVVAYRPEPIALPFDR